MNDHYLFVICTQNTWTYIFSDFNLGKSNVVDLDLFESELGDLDLSEYKLVGLDLFESDQADVDLRESELVDLDLNKSEKVDLENSRFCWNYASWLPHFFYQLPQILSKVCAL